jgi:hypothetical protein
VGRKLLIGGLVVFSSPHLLTRNTEGNHMKTFKDFFINTPTGPTTEDLLEKVNAFRGKLQEEDLIPGSIGKRGVGLGATGIEDRQERIRQTGTAQIPEMELEWDRKKKDTRSKKQIRADEKKEKDDLKKRLKQGLANQVTINPVDDPMGSSMMDKAIREETAEIIQVLEEGIGLNAASTVLQQKLITLSRRISVEDLTPKQRLGMLSKMVAIVGSLTILNSADAGRGVTGKVKALQGLRGLL